MGSSCFLDKPPVAGATKSPESNGKRLRYEAVHISGVRDFSSDYDIKAPKVPYVLQPNRRSDVFSVHKRAMIFQSLFPRRIVWVSSTLSL